MKILACLDSSTYATEVARTALDYAKAFGASLEFVHVFEMPIAYDLGAALDVSVIRKAEAEAVDARLAEAVSDEEGVVWSKVELEGGTARSIIARATETEVDLVIIGNRGRGDLLSLVLGSTSHAVIHATPCDVMVVKAA